MRRAQPAVSVADTTWPDLRTRVHCPVRAALARRIFLAGVRDLRLSVRMPDGDVFGAGRGRFESGGDPVLRIVDPDCFFSRLGRDGALGFGESYLLGAWEVGDGTSPEGSDELAAWLTTYAAFVRRRESRLPAVVRTLWHANLPTSERNSESGARRNVQAHYDLDTELFKVFLDPSMTYSCAWFERGDDLASAQRRKTAAILDLAHVDAGTRLLDVGSGFGGLAICAARERGATVTGITLSHRQFEYADSWSRRLGLAGDVGFQLEDYRRHVGTYDAITSVEMIEAVGQDNWVEYFSAVDRLLLPGGHFALQATTFPHRRMRAARNDYSWVDRYVFPGGALPSIKEIARICSVATSLEIVAARRLNDSYATTLREWRHRLLGSTQTVRRLGFDETFVRLWTLYFAYFEAGFRSRYCDVWQLGMRKRP